MICLPIRDAQSPNTELEPIAAPVLPAMAFIDPDNPLAAEILREAADSYFAACRKMVDTLEALSACDGQNDEQPERRSQLLDEAAERVHFVLIQRDAMQLSGSETFFKDYGVPAEVRSRLGHRQRKGCNPFG